MSDLSFSFAASRITQTTMAHRDGLKDFIQMKAIVDDKIPDVVRNFVTPMSNELAILCSDVKENKDTNSLLRDFSKCQSVTQSKVADDNNNNLIEEKKNRDESIDLTNLKSEGLLSDRSATANEVDGPSASLDLEKAKCIQEWMNDFSRFDEEYETELSILKDKYSRMKDKSTERKERELKDIEVQFLREKKMLTTALKDIDETLLRLKNEKKSKEEFKYQCTGMAERYLQLVIESAAFFVYFYENRNDSGIPQRYEQYLAQKQAFWNDMTKIENGTFIYDHQDP